MTGVNADVPLSADPARLNAAVAAAAAKVAALRQALSGLRIDADAKALIAKIAALEAQSVHLARAMQDMKLGVDITAARTKILAITAEIKVLQDDLLGLKLDADVTALMARLTVAEAELEKVTQARDILINIDELGALRDIGTLKAAISALQQSISSIKIDVNDTAGLAKLSALAIKAGALARTANNLTVDANIAPAVTQLLALQAQVDAFSKNLTAGAGPPRIAWGRLWGVLGTPVKLFGGAATVTALHVLIDAIGEIAAVVIPASIALAVFGVAAVPTVQTIAEEMQHVLSVSQALNKNIYPLTGSFTTLADAVQPKVYVLFGEALVVMGRNIDQIKTLAVNTGSALDTLGARAAAALSSGGFGKFLGNGAADLAKIGDIIGNIFGIIGNLLKTLPGYAEILLTVLDNVTKAFEAITANPVVQWFAGAFLAVHGFIVIAGVLVTALGAMGKWFAGLAANLGKFAAALLLSDTAAFVGGLQAAGAGLLLLGGELITFGASEDIAAAATLTFSGVLDALGAVNPLVWIAGAITGLAFLVKAIASASNSSNSFDTSLTALVTNSSVSQYAASIGSALTQANAAIAAGTVNLASLQQKLDKLPASADTANAAGGRFGAAMSSASGQVHGLVGQINTQTTTIAQNRAELSTLNTGYSNYSSLLKTAGGSQAILNASGVTSQQILSANAGQMTLLTAQVLAANKAYKAMNIGVGESAAGLNAENFAASDAQVQLAKLTQAEAGLLAIITGGQTAFNSFQQSIIGTTARFVQPSGLADAFRLAGGNLTGLNEQSLAFSNTLYNISIPAAQTMIGNLQKQGISQSNLTSVVATSAGELLHYTGNNAEANTVIIAMIQNALGPLGLNLQNVNQWVKTNSVSQGAFSKIVATSTVNAASLSGAVSTLTNTMYQNDLVMNSKLTPDMNAYTKAVINFGVNSPQAHAALQTLNTDTINFNKNTGLAITLPPQLQTQIDKLHGKTNIPVTTTAPDAKQKVLDLNNSITHLSNKRVVVQIVGQGGGSLTATQNILGEKSQTLGKLTFVAKGGKIPGSGSGDTVPAMLTPGEVVVPKGMVQAGAVDHLRGKLPGFAAGGLVGLLGGSGQDYEVANGRSFYPTAANAGAAAIMKAFLANAAAAQAAQAKTAAAQFIGSGGAGGGIIEAMFVTLAAQRGWTGAQLTALLEVEQREAGFNMTAQNPTSGAYGLAQFINGPSEYAQYGGNSTTASGQITAMLNYIAQRYGSPAAAWQHEVDFGWYNKGGQVRLPGSGSARTYDSGGWLPTGASVAVNNTGSPERVTPGGGRGRLSPDAQAIVAALQENTAAVQRQGTSFAQSLNSASGAAATRGSYSNRR